MNHVSPVNDTKLEYLRISNGLVKRTSWHSLGWCWWTPSKTL